MKKKISLMLCLCFMVLAMTACGTDPAEVDYFGMSYSDLQTVMEQDVSSLVAMTDEEREYYESYGADALVKLISSWDEVAAEAGAYQGLGEFRVTKAQNTVTAEQMVEFDNREVVVSCVFEYNYETKQPELTDANADLVYTLGEKMTKAGLNTLMGMGTVFVVLILISLIIYCFKVIPYIQQKFAAGKTPETPVQAAVPAPVVQEEENLADDLELAAVIAAAIAASEGTSTDGFVVRSIRRR